MKGLYRILKTALWCTVGVFLGTAIYRYYDYVKYGDLYATVTSAPWYVGIILPGICTGGIVGIILIAMAVIKKKSKKASDDCTE